MTNRKEILCRRCKTKLGTADHDDLILVGQAKPTQDQVIVCSVCGWKRRWNLANEPKSGRKKLAYIDVWINKLLYGRKLVSERQREWFEEERRLEREEERRTEWREEEERLERERERKRERREEARREERELERREEEKEEEEEEDEK